MQTITINVEDSVLDKVMYLLQNLSNIEIVENKKSNTQIKLDAVKGILNNRISDPLEYQNRLRGFKYL